MELNLNITSVMSDFLFMHKNPICLHSNYGPSHCVEYSFGLIVLYMYIYVCKKGKSIEITVIKEGPPGKDHYISGP